MILGKSNVAPYCFRISKYILLRTGSCCGEECMYTDYMRQLTLVPVALPDHPDPQYVLRTQCRRPDSPSWR